MPAATVRALMAGLIDYAGLFPPASISMRDVTDNVAAYRASSHAWALGRLVVPASRLDELSTALQSTETGTAPIRVSALIGGDVEGDAAAVHAWNVRESGRAVIDAIEAKVEDVAAVEDLATAFASTDLVYLEVSVTDDPQQLIAEIGRAGARAKIRTGGTSQSAFPDATDVVHFITACAKHNVPFKATAGLHHPIRGDYRLTYDDGAACGTMFGFLNVVLCASFAAVGMPDLLLAELLTERDASAFMFSDAGLAWRDHAITLNQLAQARGTLANSVGSCSFREPIDELLQLGLL